MSAPANTTAQQQYASRARSSKVSFALEMARRSYHVRPKLCVYCGEKEAGKFYAAAKGCCKACASIRNRNRAHAEQLSQQLSEPLQKARVDPYSLPAGIDYMNELQTAVVVLAHDKTTLLERVSSLEAELNRYRVAYPLVAQTLPETLPAVSLTASASASADTDSALEQLEPLDAPSSLQLDEME